MCPARLGQAWTRTPHICAWRGCAWPPGLPCMSAGKFACDVTPGKIMAQIPCCRKILACVRPGLDPHAAHLRVAGLRVAAGTRMHVCRKICMRRACRQMPSGLGTWHPDPCNEILARAGLGTWHPDPCNEILAQISFSRKILATPQPDLMLRAAQTCGFWGVKGPDPGQNHTLPFSLEVGERAFKVKIGASASFKFRQVSASFGCLQV